MKLISTKFQGLKVVQSQNFKQLYFNKLKFVFGCISSSKKGVLRGMHMQTKFSQGKYVSVIKGSILDIVVDLRKNSKTFGKHFKIILSDKNAKSVYVPPGFAHGFLGLEKENIISYLCTNYRSKKHEVGIQWNDKDLNIKWPIKKPIISKKDKNNLKLRDFIKLYK